MPAESILPAGFDVQDIDSHTVRALLASRALLVKIKRDLENHVRGLLKNLGLVIGRAKFNVFADVVEELSKNDEPLKQVRTQNVAVLFVDIVGFTAFADARTPEEVVRTLREFHALMEQEVFRHSGTLDKYLGDGLMATFGTPFTGKDDASNALRCAQAMMAAVDRWNGERKAAGEPPIRVSFGLHYGPVVLGDIGLTCLEFAVIGSTVNAASRLETLTRALGCALVASDDLVKGRTRAVQMRPFGH